MAATGSVLLRAGNGTVTLYDLPLRPAFADAVAAGRLVVVTPDDDQADTPDPDDAPAEVQVEGPPAKSAKVDDWRTYAVAQGGDEDEIAAATKQQLIDTYGQEA